MNIITSNDVDYDSVEVLGRVFSDTGLNAITKEPDGFGNARVDITFPSNDEDMDLKIIVMVWVPSREPEVLQFRAVLLEKEDRDSLEKTNVLWEEINSVVEIQNQNAFGFLSLSNMAGITLDYSLTMEGGVADSTIINTAKVVARIAQGAKSSILDEISFAD